MGFYEVLNRHFKLGQQSPIVEKDYVPLLKEQLTVWDDAHPAPKSGDPEFERGLLKWLKSDAEQQLLAAAKTAEGREHVLRPAIEALIGRPFAQASKISFPEASTQWRDSHFRTQGKLLNATYGEEVAIDWLQPINPTGEVVIWLDDAGKGSARLADGSIRPELQELIDRGVGVLTADLFLQDDKSLKQTRVVAGPREVPAYTFGYNHTLFAQRVHDVMTITSYLLSNRDASQPAVKKVSSPASVRWALSRPPHVPPLAEPSPMPRSIPPASASDSSWITATRCSCPAARSIWTSPACSASPRPKPSGSPERKTPRSSLPPRLTLTAPTPRLRPQFG